MKIITPLLIITLYLFGCTKPTSDFTQEVEIALKRYSSRKDTSYFKRYKLRTNENDSIKSFKYYRDTILINHWDFSIADNNFKLIQNTNDPSRTLVKVDTFTIQLIDENYLIHKYEYQFAEIDGETGFLFNQYLGLVGFSPYTWRNKTILIQWGKMDIQKESERLFLSSKNTYLSKQKVLLPSEDGLIKLEIIEDDVEIVEGLD